MKRFILACLLITTSGSVFSMQRIKLVTGHPCLHVSVYQGVYADLLAKIATNSDARSVVDTFITLRLQETRRCLINKTAPELPCELLADSTARNLAKRKQIIIASTVYDYGQLIQILQNMAIRKNIGAMLRYRSKSKFETWELQEVTESEWNQLFSKTYSQEEAAAARLVEEIHAHKQFIELAANLASKQ